MNIVLKHLKLSPTKYKFKIFFCPFLFHPPSHLPTIGHETLLLFYYCLFPKFNEHHTIFKKIYTASTFSSLFFFFFFFPFTSPFQSGFLTATSSLQFAPFFFFPSIYACNTTSRVKAGEPVASFSKLFLSFSL